MNWSSGKYSEFKQTLLQYINIVALLIRSLWSLEAAHANTSDVFVFWLASAATLKDLFSKGVQTTGITSELAHKVTAIFNKRFKEFFANQVYFVAFTLDPRTFLMFLFSNYSTFCVRILFRRLPQADHRSSCMTCYTSTNFGEDECTATSIPPRL